MAELTKQALKVENNTNFPNNNTGYITPALLREFNTDMIDSMVDEIGYKTDSGSWNQAIDSLNQFTASATGLNTGSLLVTASAASNVITFTKGNGSTFNVTVADTTDLSSLNAFTQSANISITNLNNWTGSYGTVIVNLQASQSIDNTKWNTLGGQSGSWVTESETGSFIITASFDNGTRNLTFTQGNASTFAVNIPDVSGSSGNFVTTSSFNSYTSSNDGRVSSLETATSSLFTSASLGLTTASVSFNTLTFRKGDGTTFNLTVDTGSGGGGTTDISSLNAYTASQDTKNAALQNVTQSLQSATASLFTSASNALVTGSIAGQILQFKKGDNSTFNINLPSGSGTVVTGSYAQFYDTTTQSGSANTPYALKFPQTAVPDGVILSGSTGMQVGAAGVYNIQFSLQAVQGASSANLNVWFKKNGVNIANSDTQWTLPSNTKLVPVVNILDQAALNDVYEIWWQSDNANTTFAAIAAGVNSPEVPSAIVTIYRVDVGGGTNSVTTGSFNAYTASMNAFTSSINSYTASNDTKWSTLGGLTGSFATTGSNVFIGNETLQDAAGNASTLTPTSGSIMLVAKTFTSASSHLTASAANQINLIFKSNNNTSDTIISGSDNIISNPAAPTAGFKRYVGGTSNIFLNTSSTPQISSSMAWSPTFQSNLIINGTGINSVTWRGPISSSASTFASNILAGGSIQIRTSATLTAEKATAGINIAGNLLMNGGLSIVANTTTLPVAPGVSSNILFGAQATLLLYSSSMQYNSNIQNGGIVVNNRYSPAGGSIVGALTPRSNINTIYGIGHDLQIDGTNTSTSQTKQFVANIIAGYYISSSMGTGDSCNILATGMIGNSLIVTGSSTVANANASYSPNNTQGSMFIGRFNATDGNRAKTAETILAVGTGISGSRKTGFLIDSGSNTFVEGTFNVSGSTAISGTFELTGSAYGNVVSMSVTSNTASMNLAAGNYFELTSSASPLRIELSNLKAGVTATLIVSASVSSSIAFSSNVGQPSPGAYSGSAAASTDILSFVAFNSSKANLVATKNIV